MEVNNGVWSNSSSAGFSEASGLPMENDRTEYSVVIMLPRSYSNK